MKKSMTAIALICTLLLAAGLSACGKPASSAPTSNVPAENSVVSTLPADSEIPVAIFPQDTTDGAAAAALMPKVSMVPVPDTVPAFLPADLQQLYSTAYFMFWHFRIDTAFGNLDYQDAITADNGMEYYRDNGFASYSDFDALLRAVFTDDYANSLLNDSMAYFNDGNNVLYTADGARGENIMYRGATCNLVSASDSEIVFTLTGHYDDSDFEIENYEPEGPSEKTFQFTLTKTENGWRFSAFDLAV